jgi:WD40 repeat protein
MDSKDKFVISGSFDENIKIFDMSHTRLLQSLSIAHKGDINSVVYSPDGKYLLSGTTERSIKILDSKTFEEIHHFKDAHLGNRFLKPLTHSCTF